MAATMIDRVYRLRCVGCRVTHCIEEMDTPRLPRTRAEAARVAHDDLGWGQCPDGWRCPPCLIAWGLTPEPAHRAAHARRAPRASAADARSLADYNDRVTRQQERGGSE